MTILEENAGLLEALRGAMTPKFLATRSAAGKPNIVPLVSLSPAEDQADLLTFGNFLLRKSIENLKEDSRVGILVITPALEGWRLRGDLLEFQSSGPYVERQKAGPLLRYNAYTGVRNAGLIRIREVVGSFRISRPQVVSEFLLARLAGVRLARRANGGASMPQPGRQGFGRLGAGGGAHPPPGGGPPPRGGGRGGGGGRAGGGGKGVRPPPAPRLSLAGASS